MIDLCVQNVRNMSRERSSSISLVFGKMAGIIVFAVYGLLMFVKLSPLSAASQADWVKSICLWTAFTFSGFCIGTIGYLFIKYLVPKMFATLFIVFLFYFLSLVNPGMKVEALVILIIVGLGVDLLRWRDDRNG